METQEQPNSSTKAVTAKRIIAVLVMSILGVLGLWWNWHLIHTKGYYYPKVALITPLAMVFAGYYSIFPEDPSVLIRPIPLRIWFSWGLSLLLGAANWYALSHGFY